MEQLPTLSFGQYNLVFNVFSLTVATFAAATIFFFLQRSRVAPEFRTAITITGLVTFIALYHYVQILFDWKGAFDLADGAYVASGQPFNDAYRYVDWLLTVPLLLVELLLVMRLSKSETVSKGWLLGGLAALMIVLGYPGEISSEDGTRWLWWCLSMIPFLIILYQLFIGLGDAIARQPAEARGLVSAARYLTVVAWLFYPVVFLFPMLGLTGAGAETALQVGYSIADIVAKAVFGLLIYTIAVRKTDAGQGSA
ncbi:MAG: bacteriorhodopsin-like [Wenzhouxiangellaceae bacterium]|nr:bacteriorhodopsin-like [Wenzhouxiangellaceae bacterium]